MSWDVELAPTAVRTLDQLPLRIAVAVVEFLTRTLPKHPEAMSQPLRGDLDGRRSARRGDYRVLFSLDDTTKTILVIRIAHRTDVCRPS